MRLFAWYRRMMHVHPWKTQLLSTGILCGSGDLVSQFVLEKKSLRQYQPSRTLHFFALGSCVIAPSCQKWYIILEKVKGAAKIVPFKKVFLDQVLFAPTFLTVFLILLRLLEGKSLQQAKQQWRQNFLNIYKNSCKLWPTIQLVNFYLVPLNYRLMLVQTISLFWNTYLAFTTSRNTDVPVVDELKNSYTVVAEPMVAASS